ncbi:hypothetical protein [Bradyrhizobium sp. SSUT77]|uniref:hypothetical protein n=1 Tax=Bradyrhizobium sp. SSUT77 TaxID=3040603 RepID=UPI00244D2B83|nr:hypothetical protein [Bradyrhizobium sp. SSUT77]MDH2343242.1 hypothetical protein [Bradyrhizobium sp. SSUT77]
MNRERPSLIISALILFALLWPAAAGAKAHRKFGNLKPTAIWNPNCWNNGLTTCNDATFFLDKRFTLPTKPGQPLVEISRYIMAPADVPFRLFDGQHNDVSDIDSVVLSITYIKSRTSETLKYELEYRVFNRVQDDRALRTVPYLVFGGPIPYRDALIDSIGDKQSGRRCGWQKVRSVGSLPLDLHDVDPVVWHISMPDYQGHC